MNPAIHAEPAELRKFEALAHEYWDPEGPLRTLHALNPLRLAFVAARVSLDGAEVADVGCGGGLLAEGLARAGARVTGIDLAPAMIEVARMHADASGLAIDYRLQSAAALAAAAPAAYAAVCCMELIEHHPEPMELVGTLARLLRPGGSLFIATINRTPQAFCVAILGGEYLLRLVPRGTHEYARLVRPAEIARAARQAGLELLEVAGVGYDPIARRAYARARTDVNYLVHFRRPAEDA
jgi:2-polyprenyl-6-hydroxyphenyl methylase/3-demethylubiquinone-9 3-methyltransferase